MYNFPFLNHTTYRAHKLVLNEGDERKISLQYPAFLFTTHGKLSVLYHETCTKEIEKGQIFLLPQDFVCSFYCIDKCEITMFEIPDIVALVIHFIPNISFSKQPIFDDPLTSVLMNNHLTSFYEVFNGYFEEEKIDKALLSIKIMELFYLLGKCYSADTLRNLFTPVMSDGYNFALFVLSNYTKVKNIDELATSLNYSTSGFEKQFRKVFGMPPYKWILHKKASRLYRDILVSQKPLKVIAQEYDFCNLSHLGDFCRKYFGVSPSLLRNKSK